MQPEHQSGVARDELVEGAARQPGPQGPQFLGVASRPEAARVALLVLTTLVVMGVITYLGPILKPFLVAVFLYFSLRSAATFLVRWHLPRLVAYLTLLVIGGVVAAILGLLVYGEALSLTAEWPQYQRRIQAVIGEAPTTVRRPLAELYAESSQEVYKFFFERGIGVLELLVMAFFYLLFILLGSSGLTQRVLRAFPNGGGARVLAVTDEIGTGMERFLQVKTLVSLGLGFSSAVLMLLFGLHGWLVWGALFFVLNYITYIGSMVACVPPIVLAFLDLNSLVPATVLGSLIVLNRFFWIDYLEIKLSGRHLNIDSILLFLWLAYWGWAWGVVGLILSFPMLTSLKIVMESLESTKPWAVLMGEK